MKLINPDDLSPHRKAFLFRLWSNKIVEQAIKDYRTAIKTNKPSLIGECEAFFRSDWFKFLTDYDGEFLMKKIRVASVEEIEDWKRKGFFHRNGKFKEIYKLEEN